MGMWKDVRLCELFVVCPLFRRRKGPGAKGTVATRSQRCRDGGILPEAPRQNTAFPKPYLLSWGPYSISTLQSP